MLIIKETNVSDDAMEKEDLHAIDENVNPINETTMEISI
jgi:hypothetical protein